MFMLPVSSSSMLLFSTKRRPKKLLLYSRSARDRASRSCYRGGARRVALAAPTRERDSVKRLFCVLMVALLAAGCSGSDATGRFNGAYGGVGVGAGKP